MPRRTVTVASAIGLHARPASLFCRAAAELGTVVTINGNGGRRVNAASILGVLSLGVSHGDTVTLPAEGPGADAALDAVVPSSKPTSTPGDTPLCPRLGS